MEKIELKHKSILVTGGAGFIGSNLIKRLFHDAQGATIVNLDNMNDYYDVSLKEYRLQELDTLHRELSTVDYQFVRGDLADKALIDSLFAQYKFEVVVNLAAQAGVRYSITNPDAYIQSNMIGFYNILEACRHRSDYARSHGERPVAHLVYASSSSVYGGNKKVPFSTDDRVDNPVSLYAATKKSNELFAHCYSKLYDIPTTGLRFFTVYGPAGRPDMAYFGFTNKLIAGKTIQIYNYGNCRRDFTYVDDIVEGIVRVMAGAPERKTGDDGLPVPPYAVYNIGGGQPENLLDFVNILQEELVRAGVLPQDYDFEAHKELVPMQPGDVPTTYADATALERDFGFTPKITLREGLRKFAEWYKLAKYSLLMLAFFLVGCANYKDVPYFQNSAQYDGSQGAQLYDMTIKPKDQLTIFVFSGTNADAVDIFNPRDPRPLEMNNMRDGGIRMPQNQGGQIHRYFVENDGTIDFPVVGRVKVGGLTVTEVNKKILGLVRPYLSQNTDCVVNTYIENYVVSVMGEVNRPNTFTVSRNRLNVLEALAMAGDMTIYGKRDNVKLLREMPSGEYEIHELDLRDANLLNSPYYYLHQRDVIYVEPNLAMAQNASIGQTRTLWIRGIQISLHLGSLLYRVLR